MQRRILSVNKCFSLTYAIKRFSDGDIDTCMYYYLEKSGMDDPAQIVMISTISAFGDARSEMLVCSCRSCNAFRGAEADRGGLYCKRKWIFSYAKSLQVEVLIVLLCPR